MSAKKRKRGGERDDPHPRPGEARGTKPLVAIVGRPNVGKSTLFNRLAGKQIAIVEDVPGVTRDRHYADADALGRPFVLVDTGGFDPESEQPRTAGIVQQVRTALEECDVVLCVLDATAEPLDADREAVALLRQSSKPVLYVANKAESQRRQHQATTYYELGIESILPVSAMHGNGTGDLEEALCEVLPEEEQPDEPTVDAEIPRVSVVGRPNAGKSSLINRLLGQDRQLVDAQPGTTVDSIDTLLERNDGPLVFIDTAGMRRKRAKKESVESLSVYQAIRAMERSDVVVLMIDALEGPAEQDAKIAGLADDRGRALILAVNKMDCLSEEDRKKALRSVRDVISFVPWAPVVRMSAKTGRGVGRLLTTIDEVVEQHRKRVTTSEVNRFFDEVLEHHPPPTFHNKPVRLYYITQADTRPPTFVISTNEPKGVHFSYRRYVVNQLRKRFGFHGTPVQVRYRGKSRR